MTEARTYASLSSGLLARKGAAKPAMRPQGFNQFGTGLEDLGWNDMGPAGAAEAAAPEDFAEPHAEHVPSSIAALTPAPRPARFDPSEEVGEVPAPPVVEQRRAIAENLGAVEEEPEDASSAPPEEDAGRAEVVSMPPRKPAEGKGRKAAFTLRLDPERHLRLRLACAIDGRSAQQIVTDALDVWLQSVPEVETMAERAAGGRRN